MKQTNNAIKFLMAQYRAIFKNAYFKGLTSAVLLTAGLAAGAAQAATNIDEDVWGNLTAVDGVTTVTGTDSDDGTSGNYTDFSFNTSGTISTDAVQNIIIENKSGGNTVTASGAALTVTGTNTTIELNAATAASGALAIKASGANAATLTIRDLKVGVGQLTIGEGTATSGATLEALNTIDLLGGTDSKIIFNGSGADTAILQGRLVSNVTDATKLTTLEFSGAGTLKTYTDDTGAKADITVAAEASGTLDLSGDDETKKLLRLNDGTFTITGHGTDGSGASFTVKHGTLAVDDAVFLTAGTTGDTDAGELVLNADTAGEDATDAVLRVSSAQLKSFLTADKGVGVTTGTDDKAGRVTLTKGTIELTDSNAFDVSTLSFAANSSPTSGSIEVGSDADSSIIKGTTLSIATDGLKDVSALTVQADTLKLTELAGQDEKNQLFKGKTIAANYDVTLNTTANNAGTPTETAADNAYTVSHEMGWLSTTEVNNPYRVANNDPADPEKITVAANGTIGHDYIVTSGDTGYQGNFHIIGGHYTDANDIELKNGGKLTVGNVTTGQGVGIDASLTLTSAGSLTLNNSGSYSVTNEIEITGNASGDKWHTETNNDAQFVPESVLDLSQGTIQFAYDDHDAPAAGKTYQVQTNITVGANGELIVRDDQMNYLLNNLRELEQRDDAVSGAAINLSGGTVTVKGDLELEISDISTTANAGNKIHFDTTSGGTLAADNIVIEEKDQNPDVTTDTGTPLNLGNEGTLKAETITLNNRSVSSDPKKGYVDYQVIDGNLQVGSALSSVNSTVILGSGSSGASLTLGYIEHNKDEYRIHDNGTYNLSAETGTVEPNLNLSGTGSALTINYGAWTLKNSLEASNATIKVGSEGFERDANGDLYTASLTGQGLTLHAGTNMTVNRNAEVTFDTFKMDGSTAQVHVNNTTMTIKGKHTEASGSVDESWGLEVTGGTVTVKGREGVLAIGAEALSSISATKGTDGKFTLANDLPGSGFVTLEDWGTLSLELDSNDVFGEESLVALRQAFLSNTYSVNGAPVDEGYIDIGAAHIEGITVNNGQVSWTEMQKYKDIIADIVSADTSNATLVDVTSATDVQANVGNVKADGNTQVVNFNDTSLRAGTNGFVKNANGENIDANVNAGSRLGLYNGGSIENVTLQAGDSDVGTTELSVISSAAEGATEPETTIASVDGKGHDDTSFVVQGNTTVNGKVDVGELVVDKALTIKGEAYAENGLYSTETKDADGNVSLVNTGVLTVNTLEVRGGAEYAGSIKATGAVEFGGVKENADEKNHPVDYYLAGNNTFTDVTFHHDTDLAKGKTIAENVHLGQGLSVYDGATLDANVVDFTAGSTTGYTIFVGSPAETDASGNVTKAGTSGFMNIGRLDLAGRSLIVDPDYGSAASVVAIGQLGKSSDVTALLGNDAGTLNGSVIGLQNSIVGIGVTDTADQSAIEQLRTTFASYLDGNGSLSNTDGQVGAVVYTAKSLDLNENSKIVVDANRNAQKYLDLMNGKVTNPTQEQTDYVTAVNSNNVYLGANSVLALGQQALAAQTTAADGTKKDRAALHFNDVDASIYTNGGKVVLVGDYNVDEDLILFTDTGTNTGVKIVGPEEKAELVVESLSGLYVMTLTGETTGGKLEATGAHALTRFYAASEPVRALLNEYYLRESTAAEDRLVGERAPRNISYNASTQTFTDTTTNTTVTGFTAVPNGDGTYTIYENAYNEILNETVAKDFSGATAETAARMGAYAGVAQAALAAGASTYDSISSRMGIGAQSSTMTFAENGQGAGLWLNPIYKSHDSDGFDAQGADYGVDMDLYGVALGADYTLANGLRFGAMFNVGSGDADGQGAGSAVSNDFDYYGFGAFVGYTMGAFSVVGDVSYTAVDNDVEANLGFDKVGASLDSTNLSVGVTGKYALDLNGVSVTPHAGLRYSSIDIDDYSVDGEQTYAHFSSQSMDVFSIPVGVTVAKDIVAGSWTVKPSFDLTLTGNFGDDEFEGDVNWEGISNHVTQTSTEVLDNFTYGATLGVAAQTGNFSLGLGVNYTGSSNVDEFGVQANARFVF